MQAQAYEGYFDSDCRLLMSGQTITIPGQRRVFIVVYEEMSAQNDVVDDQLIAMDRFIAAIKSSDEEVPEFERLKLREVEL